ncbi:gfo/Idh/MocA family oxidoreductase, partial [Salmonella enterica subsp. enterica serovar Infantis]
MDNHRTFIVGRQEVRVSLFVEYLHVVDSGLWLAGGVGRLGSGTLVSSVSGVMGFAEVHFSADNRLIST